MVAAAVSNENSARVRAMRCVLALGVCGQAGLLEFDVKSGLAAAGWLQKDGVDSKSFTSEQFLHVGSVCLRAQCHSSSLLLHCTCALTDMGIRVCVRGVCLPVLVQDEAPEHAAHCRGCGRACSLGAVLRTKPARRTPERYFFLMTSFRFSLVFDRSNSLKTCDFASYQQCRRTGI